MTDSDRQRRSAASRAYKTVNARYCIDGADFFPSTPSKQRPHVTGSRPGCHVSGPPTGSAPRGGCCLSGLSAARDLARDGGAGATAWLSV